MLVKKYYLDLSGGKKKVIFKLVMVAQLGGRGKRINSLRPAWTTKGDPVATKQNKNG
jgi:hypothetical protein